MQVPMRKIFSTFQNSLYGYILGKASYANLNRIIQDCDAMVREIFKGNQYAEKIKTAACSHIKGPLSFYNESEWFVWLANLQPYRQLFLKEATGLLVASIKSTLHNEISDAEAKVQSSFLSLETGRNMGGVQCFGQ